MELKMEKVLLIMVVMTLIVAAAQAFQLINIKNSLDEGDFSIGSASTKIATASPSSSGSIIDIQAEIPDQVGGCF